MQQRRPNPERAVLDMLVDLTNRQREEIRYDDRLLNLVTGDDCTILVRSVEETLGVKTNPKDWEKVSTVGQAIKVFEDASSA